MKRIVFLFAISLAGFTIFACAPEVVSVEKPVPVEVEKKGLEEKWEEILRAARKEGRVVVYGGSAAAALKLHATKIIKEKFGLDLEVLTGRGGEVVSKIIVERRAGLFIPDVYASGMSSIFDTLKPMGAIDPLERILILPEIIDRKGWYGDELPWGDKDRMILNWAGVVSPPLLINTDMLQPAEIKSYQDLLNPKWKGKIVMGDPTTSGIGLTGFMSSLHNKILHLDFFRHLAKQQDIAITRDQHLQILWVVRGKFPIGLFPSSGRAKEYLDAGAHLAWQIPVEGTHMGGSGSGLAVMNKAPHPNAATIFMNWFLSREGQVVIQKSTGKQSLRIDIPLEGIDPLMVRQPGVKYFPDPGDSEKFALEEQHKYVSLAAEIFFGSLLR